MCPCTGLVVTVILLKTNLKFVEIPLYSCSGNAVVFRGHSTRTSKKYNGNTTHDWGVQRLYNGKYNAFKLVFKRVTVTRSYNDVQTQTLVVTFNPVYDTLFRPWVLVRSQIVLKATHFSRFIDPNSVQVQKDFVLLCCVVGHSITKWLTPHVFLYSSQRLIFGSL